METAEIRRRFLQYFAERGHTVVPSAPLLFDDPNLLFVNAGMVQFVPYLIGQETPPYQRATSVQKCVRTLDIEEVGKTTRHGTFFQMNGNFSFGDYFKEEAITFAWDLVIGHLGFDPNKVWVTVLHSDDEAVSLWHEVAGLPDERIQRRGLKDNYWHMGIPGPGGPCSEIYIDRGPEYGPDGGPVVDEDRFLEIWNLVFMQEQLSAVRAKDDFDTVGELPSKNIDTGMGLERVAYLLQGVDNLYEIDEVYPVIERASELTGRPYGGSGANPVDDVRFRVIADHVRSALMLIGDGVRPGNEARGYVLRRLIRRVVRSMRLLGVEDRTLPELLPVSKDRMKTSYPELEQDWNRISQIAYAEEDTFRETLKSGTQIFENAVIEARTAGESELTGWKAFQLHDTYGFPIDLTLEMAAEQGLRVDEPEFRRLMTEQRERAKADARAKKTKHADLGAYRALADDLGRPVEFTGYDEVVSEATVRGIMTGAGARAQAAKQGDEIELVLDRTPFYAEGGGQLADAGVIELQDGARIEVLDVQSPINGLIVHSARVLQGEVQLGAGAQARVDVERRRSISRSHTATHMVHKAIREALGDTATQAGSENSPGRFRFDFSATGAVPVSVLQDVEGKVNDLVLADLAVEAEIMTQEQAKASGAMALFGEKYGDQVRVISVGDWARELCGGTHTHRSGQLGVIKLLGESSIGSGVRRIEALVGADAYRFLAREHVLVAQLSEALKAPPQELPDRVADLVERLRNAEKEIQRVRAGQVLAVAGELAAKPRDVFGVSYVGHRTPDGVSGGDLRKLALDVRGRMPADRPAVVTIVGTTDGKPGVVVALNDTARSWRLKAGDLVRVAAEALGGRGGGKDDVAQGGGTNPAGVDAALAGVEHAIGQQVTGG